MMTLKSKFVLSSAALVFGALLSTSAFVGCSGSGTVNNPPQTTTDTTKMVPKRRGSIKPTLTLALRRR
jgi:hypothetical protein